jgi:hypothetical protein
MSALLLSVKYWTSYYLFTAVVQYYTITHIFCHLVASATLFGYLFHIQVHIEVDEEQIYILVQ